MTDVQIRVTRAALREAAGPIYFARGEAYFDNDTVAEIRESSGIVKAVVHGTNLYKTALLLGQDHLDGRCSCPLGKKQEFCKHLVATGLAYIEQRRGAGKQSTASTPITSDDIESYLSKRKKAELVRMIMQQAAVDGELFAMLEMTVAAKTAKGGTQAMREILRSAMSITDFISWRDTGSYTRGIDGVMEQLKTMLNHVHAAGIMELAEYGMDLWEDNIDFIDDSDGCMGMIRDDLHELHFAACKLAKPDKIALAERLSRRAMDSAWEMFDGAYRTYHSLLGDVGRARYRDIVQAEWVTLPPLGVGEEDPERYGRRRTLKEMMLAFAEDDDDLSLAISVLSRDLSHACDYLLIAQTCRNSRQYKHAREWAEKGVTAFPGRPDSQLRLFLAEEYVRAKMADEAIAMVWANFQERETVENYQVLAKYACKLKSWEVWREKAFDHMRATLKERQADSSRARTGKASRRHAAYNRWAPAPPDHSLIVAVLLWEKRVEEAWSEAEVGSCSPQLWQDLAKRREKMHPEDAIAIYRQQVDSLIQQTNNSSYEQAVEFLGTIHRLMGKIGKQVEFKSWLTELKTEYKRKRNFITYVERKAWGKS